MNLHDVMDMKSREKIYQEVREIFLSVYPEGNFAPVEAAFQYVTDLFDGKFSAYKACNTRFHDLEHTLLTFLAMARLMHGVSVSQRPFREREFMVGLVAALFHDVGYIQEQEDEQGTGGKFTKTHVERGIEMLRDMGQMLGLRPIEVEDAINHIRFTDLALPVDSIRPRGQSYALIGRILGSVDILAQMADRAYLEKLPYLFDEFKESGIDLFKDATDMLLRTPEFYKFIQGRLKNDLWDVHRHMKAHFKHRLGVEEDLYQSSVKRSMVFLGDVCKRDATPWSFLKRDGIVCVSGNDRV